MCKTPIACSQCDEKPCNKNDTQGHFLIAKVLAMTKLR